MQSITMSPKGRLTEGFTQEALFDLKRSGEAKHIQIIGVAEHSFRNIKTLDILREKRSDLI